MSDGTAQHDHTPDTAGLNPFFREPQLAAGYDTLAAAVAAPRVCQGGDYCDEVCPGLGLGPCQPPAPAQAPQAPAGPEPLLEGTFAIYVTPQEALVVAYRPRGAQADKQFVVPAFLIAMATQRTGHSLADVVKGLKEQGE